MGPINYIIENIEHVDICSLRMGPINYIMGSLEWYLDIIENIEQVDIYSLIY